MEFEVWWLIAFPVFFGLGWLADRIGIQNAYGMVIILVIAAAAVVISNGLRQERKAASYL